MKQKTLQEQYNLIKEGKGNAEVFMKAAKKQFPNFVRNAATLNETISSLKHNHIISESMLGLGMVSSTKPTTPDWFKIFNENMEVVAEEAKAVEKKPTKDVVDLETKGYDYKDKEKVDNIYGEAFLKGYYTEMKDPKNADKTVDELKEIVAKNLAKDRLYYTKEAQFGVKGIGYTDQTPGLKASKSDQMEKVKLDEAKKPKKETANLKLAEIEKNGKIATLEIQIDALDEIIEAKNQRISMVTEDENLSELVDKNKMKEMQREIKELEKRKAKMEKLYEKMCGKRYAKKEVVDEVNINPKATEDRKEADKFAGSDPKAGSTIKGTGFDWEKKYDPDEEQKRDEDEIFMAYDDEGKPL